MCSNQNWPISMINIRINRECKTTRKIILIPRLDRGHLPKVGWDTISCLSITLSWLVSLFTAIIGLLTLTPVRLQIEGKCRAFAWSFVTTESTSWQEGSISQDEMFRNVSLLPFLAFESPPNPSPLPYLIRLHSLDKGICDIAWNIWELRYYNY